PCQIPLLEPREHLIELFFGQGVGVEISGNEFIDRLLRDGFTIEQFSNLFATEFKERALHRWGYVLFHSFKVHLGDLIDAPLLGPLDNVA
ncbi:hypothetical protein PMAYCL1PPCAC_09470, partial [Pristionchus mayeri]